MQKVFLGGTILTMNKELPVAEAVLIEDEAILKVGTKKEVLEAARSGARIINLKGNTLMPGFIDAHGHFLSTVLTRMCFVDVRCAPLGEVKNIPHMIRMLKNSPQAKKGKGPIVGFGFDEGLTEEGRLAEASDLDEVSESRPVLVIHSSMHLVMANTKAMEEAGVDGVDFRPSEGVVRRRNGKCVGIFEEMPATVSLMELAFKGIEINSLLDGIGKTSEGYLSNGVTTICEGSDGNKAAGIIKLAIRMGKFSGHYIICPTLTREGQVPERIKGKHIINGPVKLSMDGSLQCFGACLSAPYSCEAPGREGDREYCGTAQMNVETLRNRLETVLESNRSFSIHCSGDGALDMILEALEGCDNLKRNFYKRNLIIHCQLAREEQLERMKNLNLIPSFYAAHLYHWGDRHYSTILGEERAERLNPVASAVRLGLKYSLHGDSPVNECCPLELVWNAATRKTREGRILGEAQKVTVSEALKGITIYGAYQYKVEDILGSIEEGKTADLIALDRNPLEVDEDEVKDIKVKRVWVDGKIAWSDTCSNRSNK